MAELSLSELNAEQKNRINGVAYDWAERGSPGEQPLDIALEHLAMHLCRVGLQINRYLKRFPHRSSEDGAAGPASKDGAMAALDRIFLVPTSMKTTQCQDNATIAGEIEACDTGMRMLMTRHSQLASPRSLPIEDIRAAFGLDEDQVRLLIGAAAPQILVDTARLYRYAVGEHLASDPTVGFLTELVADRPADAFRLVRHFREESPLVRHRLVLLDERGSERGSGLLHRGVTVADSLVRFIIGEGTVISSDLNSACSVSTTPAVAVEELHLQPDTRAALTATLQRLTFRRDIRIRPCLIGLRGSGRRTALESYLGGLVNGVLTVDTTALPDDSAAFEDMFTDICRTAKLGDYALLIRCDGLIDRADAFTRLGAIMSHRLADQRMLVAFAARRRSPELRNLLPRLVDIEFPIPTHSMQKEIWLRAIDHAGYLAPEGIDQQLARQCHLPPGAIYRAVSMLEATVRTGSTVTEKLLSQALSAGLTHRLSDLAEPFTTGMQWEDVVLQDELRDRLDEVLLHAQERAKVFEEWGFGEKVTYGAGLSCLFSGAPGTGKTMMAALLAKRIGKAIFRVDVSRLVSKWVGETEKNIARIFDEAEAAQVMLLFDEADSIFSKRTEVRGANDRFANMEVNYLLQRMESYNGITILTTNNEKGIDQAFKRRIRFRLHFELPDAELRSELWKKQIPSRTRTADDIDFERLGHHFEMSGGNIKNAVLRAAFRAAAEEGIISEKHLFRAGHAEATEMGMLVRGWSADTNDEPNHTRPEKERSNE